MKEFNKIFGIGMSKTGTSTLAACLDILAIGPHKSFDRQLKALLESGQTDKIIPIAKDFRSFEDSPWYHLYEQLDRAYPNSLFILTVRKNSQVHATSSWHHGVNAGRRKGKPSDDYIKAKIKSYEDHNQAVRQYFSARPNDFLEVCWENGDGWQQLCDFLEMEIPNISFPHANTGSYKSQPNFLKRLLSKTPIYALILRLKHFVVGSSWFQRFKTSTTKN